MDFKNLSEKETIFYHLTLDTDFDQDTRVYSTLTNLLKECRTATSRDVYTGGSVNQNNMQWLGILGYFVVLDQIGKCYKPKDVSISKEVNDIKRALYHFSELSKAEIDALVQNPVKWTHFVHRKVTHLVHRKVTHFIHSKVTRLFLDR